MGYPFSIVRIVRIKQREPCPSPFERTRKPAVLCDPSLENNFVVDEGAGLEVLLHRHAGHGKRDRVILANNSVNNNSNTAARRSKKEVVQRFDGCEVRDALTVD